MALTLEELFGQVNYKYGLRMVAGEKGLEHIVQWVHTLEDAQVAEFLHGGELVFTTGIAHSDTDWILPFVKVLKEKDASGIVVNIGPYIPEVPNEVIQYCNDNDLPLFTIPWEIHIIDISKDFCDRIFQMDRREESIGQSFENIIFYPDETDKYMQILESNGFDLKWWYCCIGIRLEALTKEAEENLMFTSHMIKRRLYNSIEHIGNFTWNGYQIYILGNCEDAMVEELEKYFTDLAEEKKAEFDLKVAISHNRDDIYKLSQNYRRVLMMLKFSQQSKEKVLNYYYMGAKKLLMSIEDKEVLHSYEEEMLGKLIAYDRDNNTDLSVILRNYLECDGSVQSVSEKLFIHRNTVNYQIKKIKKILGSDISGLEERMQIYLAYQIHDIL